MKKTLTLDGFKELVKTDDDFKQKLVRHDILDRETGLGIIYRENLMKEMERFMCKDEEDLSNTLYNAYGIFVRIVD